MQTVYVSATANIDRELVFALLTSGAGVAASGGVTFTSGEAQWRKPAGTFATVAGTFAYQSAQGNQGNATGIFAYRPDESELANAGTGVLFITKPNYQPVWERVQIREALENNDAPMISFVAKDSTQRVPFRVKNLRGQWDSTTDVSAGDLFISLSAASGAVAGGTVTNLGNLLPGLRAYTLTGSETVGETKAVIRMNRKGLTSGGVDAEVATPISLTSAGEVNSRVVSQASAAVIDVNMALINDVVVSGVGTSANPWQPDS